MLTANDLAFMRETEVLAMSSTATVYKPSYVETALGFQDETWTNSGTVACDVWPISRQGNEHSSENQELAEKYYYISVPYNANVNVTDKLLIDSVLYDVSFVPVDQSWLTNKRLEARNYNNSINITDGGSMMVLESGYLFVLEG